MKLLLIIILFFMSVKSLSAMENKIITKIENEIITSIDIENEKNYLIALNPNIRNLKNDRLNLISKNSLIRENIKKNEILKYTEKIKLDEVFLNNLIQQRYVRLNLKNKEEFLLYIKEFNINIETIEKKFSIEALWNQLIYQKFSKNIKINKKKLIKEIKLKFSDGEKNFLLSEIVFNIKDKNDLNEKYTKILNDIYKENFESAALIHSISDSSAVGGKLGGFNLAL